MRKYVVIFPLWAALISGCALFDSPETEGEKMERAAPVVESPVETAAAPVESLKTEPRPARPPRAWSTEDIRGMQTRLREVGFDPGPTDGVVGARTKAAFNKFQAGCVQAQPLLNTLGNGAATGAALNLSPSRQETAAMQTPLRQAGFNPGPVDGVFGAKTKAVFAELQSGCPMAKDFAQFLAQPLSVAQPTIVAQIAERTNFVTASPISPARGRADAVRPSITPVTARSQEEIRILQLRLRDAGYDPGPFDGVMGRKTQVALQQLQASQRAGKTKTALTMGLNGHY